MQQHTDTPKLTHLLQGLPDYMTAERHFRPRTTRNYIEDIRFFIKIMGDLTISQIDLNHFISFKARMVERKAGASRIASIINAMKCLFAYSRDVLSLPVIDPKIIKAPRAPRREVVYLNAEELEKFMAAVRLTTFSGEPRTSGYCVRALIETLAATGMRISEALALHRDSIDMQNKEAVIVGKGGKQRTVYFTDRALHWITRYLRLRSDSSRALFVNAKSGRLSIYSVHHTFRRLTRCAGLKQRVTPHIIRHTLATSLLRNGCPIGFIKEILGHEQLGTTCRYYLGMMTKQETKYAHQTYSHFMQFRPNSLPTRHPRISTDNDILPDLTENRFRY
jgi:integrase/recombinase XerD